MVVYLSVALVALPRLLMVGIQPQQMFRTPRMSQILNAQDWLSALQGVPQPFLMATSHDKAGSVGAAELLNVPLEQLQIV
jgi:hypothetical protein